MKAVVVTTINPPSEAIENLSKKKDWQLYVVGDKKTPHELFHRSDLIYLSPRYQEQNYQKISKILGWNNIQRRNIGFIQAIKDGAEIVATIDDDNIPNELWENNLIGSTITINSYNNSNGLFDPLSITNISKYWHRGYPLKLVESRKENIKKNKKIEVKVQAGLWNGKPDIDVISKIIHGDNDETITGPFPYCSSKTIFSSQNAFIHKSLMPHYAVLPFCGRMDDIWGAIILQQRTNCEIVFSTPSTFHKRNSHNILDDLKNEIIWHEKTLEILSDEKNLPCVCKKFLDEYYKEMTC